MQNERKVESKFINQTFKAAHKVILDYMCEGNKKDIDSVHAHKIYWSKEEIEKEANTLHGKAPENSLLKVDSKALYEKYF